jgi:perosamine synthetase
VSGTGCDGNIGLSPGFSVMGQLRGRCREFDVYPLHAENSRLFFSARYALSGAIRALGMRAGDSVLIPSYNCGTEIDPFRDQHVRVRFYKIRRDMSIDVEDMIDRIDRRTKAILVTHYVGFPQPIDAVKRV